MSNVPEYRGEETGKRSRVAVASLVLGFVALVPILGMPFAIGAIICGIIALAKAGKPPYMQTGKGFAVAGIVMGGMGLIMIPVVSLLIAILLPSLGKARELANRSACAANLRGIESAMIIYSAENTDQYPTLPYAPYSASNGVPSGGLGAATADTTIEGMYGSGSSVKGSPTATQWVLVLKGMSPRLYLCKSDTFVTTPVATPAPMLSGSTYYKDFQAGNQISYSFAYPYAVGREGPVVGPWWRNTEDSSLPIAADMAPLNGTGTPARDVTAASAGGSSKVRNSANHQGDGQNVVYADCHVDYVKRPDVGQSNDNIYSLGGAMGPTGYGGTQPVKSPVVIPMPLGSPYDIYMVPTRNLDTGGL